ncbi:hypothetical protein ACQY0O_003472 [Thecaphora frezii]
MAAAAAASSPVSSPSPLPAELICSIVRHAASTCPTTARTLSLVSHSVCRWTIEERWRTLVCTTPEQLIKLWLLFLECADRVASHSSSSVDGSHPTTTVGTAGLPISYPPQGPGGLVRNLFLDTTPSYMPHDGVTYSAYKEALQRIELAPARAAARLSGLLYHMPALEYLALGAAEMQLLQPSLMSVAPFELLIVYDGDDALLSGLFLSGTQKLAHWYEGGHEHDGRRSKSEKRPTLDALASLYGWNGTSPSRAQYVSRIRQGFAPDDVVALQAVERAVQRQSGAASQKQRQGEVKGEIKLGFHPRKPDEFVRLATNPAALTRQERLEIFLDTARGREASW